ncbi:MAG: EAL domain-containing protein [Candidatus Methylopumilus sp.]
MITAHPPAAAIKNKLLSGIFGHFFIRTSIIQSVSGLLLLMVVLPFFNNISDQMAAEQGRTFSNSTLAATYNALYKEDYSQIIDYCMNVMRDTPNILMIVYSNRNGEEIIMTRDKWMTKNKSLPYYKMHFAHDNTALIGKRPYQITSNSTLLSPTKHFEFSTPIAISFREWGVLTVSFSKDAYFSIVKSFYWTVIIFTILSCLLSLFLFFASSSRIRRQLSIFTSTTKNLAEGKLSARAPEKSIGEIGELGKAINEMSSSLQEKSSRLFQLVQIVEQTNDAFILFNKDLNIVFVNDAVTNITGYPAKYFEGLHIVPFSDALNLDLADLLREIEWMDKYKTNPPSHDIVITKQNQSALPVEMRLEFIENSEKSESHLLAVLSSLTERKKLENELHQLAFFDKLTGLPNRRMFLDHLNQIIRFSHYNNQSFALFFMDLDNFKYINDSLGHEVGDELLVKIAGRLKAIFRATDMVTRLGGDEFTVIIENTKENDRFDVTQLAQKLLDQLASLPIEIGGRNLTINTSIGIAKFPENGLDSDTLLRHADTAMYAAKKSGKNRYALFTEDMNTDLRQHMEMESELKDAIRSQDQLMLQYQPIVDLKTGELVGAEALARWHHPKKGFISPSDFIPVAEKSDLMIELGDTLLKMAFKQARLWEGKQHAPYLSVNISVKQFAKDDFVDRMIVLLQAFQINAHNILLEFTESVMLDSSNETFTKFEKLKKVGFQIGIDDFGTGYSSMGYIHKLPIDILKIDRTFVSEVTKNKKSQAIVSAITKLSSSLGIKTIAEGVERKQDAQWLETFHCDYGQGYLYDQALNIEDFEKKYLHPSPTGDAAPD